MEQEIEFSLEDLQPGTNPVTPAEEDFVLEAAAPAAKASVSDDPVADEVEATADEVAAQDAVPVAATVADEPVEASVVAPIESDEFFEIEGDPSKVEEK